LRRKGDKTVNVRFGKWKKVRVGQYEFYLKGKKVASVHSRDGLWEISYTDERENFFYGGVDKRLYGAQVAIMYHFL